LNRHRLVLAVDVEDARAAHVEQFPEREVVAVLPNVGSVGVVL
jgi:hypothetical protein